MSPKFDQKILSSMKGRRVAVIGDVMLDQFVEGVVKRRSPEANAPIVLWQKENNVLGGAANVAANIKALGGNPEIFSVIGLDETGGMIKDLLAKAKIKSYLLVDKSRPATLKVRIFGNGRYLLRFDKETDKIISPALSKKLLLLIRRKLSSYDAIVLSDYKKGVFSSPFARSIIASARALSIPIIADIKPNNVSWFKGVSIVKPNHKEAMEIAGTKDLRLAAQKISHLLKADTLITKGGKGMLLYSGQDKKFKDIKGVKVSMRDIVGAGDAVVASLSILLAAGNPVSIAAEIANIVGAISVTKHGTVSVSHGELRNYLKQ